MWRLEHIAALWWWLIIPIAVMAIYSLTQKRTKKLSSLGNPEKIRSLIQSESPQQTLVKRSVWFAAITLLILAMANLQSGTEEESVTNKGSNVVIALDLSNSMLAKDIAPDRLERSKKFLTNLVSKFGGDRVAFIIFAGRAYIQMPFTTDYGAFEMHLRSVNTDVIPTQGTALGEAIAVAESMQTADDQQEKVLILLSDGEDHDSKAVSIAKQAASNKMIIHTIGAGTTKGAPIPEKSRAGGVSYKRDNSGNQILSRLNEDVLKEIASAGGGKYFNISDDKKALKEIQRSIKWAAGSTGEEKIYTRYKNYFQWFLFPAILLLMLELAGVHILSFRGKKRIVPLLLLVCFMGFLASCVSKDEKYKAYESYQKADFAGSLKTYQEIMTKDSSAESSYNAATGFHALLNADSALALYDQALQKQPDTLTAARTLFNKGCIFFYRGDFKSAADAFKNSLRYQQGNYRTQYNLSLTLALLPPQDQDEKQNKDQDKNQENKDEKNQDQENKDDQKENSDQKKDQNGKDKDDQKDQPEDKEEPKQDDKKDTGKDNGPQKQQPQQGKLSPQDVQRLFQALDQQEKAVQKRIMTKQGEQSGQPYIEKDW